MVCEQRVIDTWYYWHPETSAYRVDGLCPFPDLARKPTRQEQAKYAERGWVLIGVHERRDRA